MRIKLMPEKPYDSTWTGPFCTPEGEEVRIITHTKGTSETPVVFVVFDPVEGKKIIRCCPADGTDDGRPLLMCAAKNRAEICDSFPSRPSTLSEHTRLEAMKAILDTAVRIDIFNSHKPMRQFSALYQRTIALLEGK